MIIFLAFCRSAIREKIIPHAVSWFTGEAMDGEEFDLDDDDEDDDIDEDEDEDEEDDEEDEEDDEDEEDSKTKKEGMKCANYCFVFNWSCHILCAC